MPGRIQQLQGSEIMKYVIHVAGNDAQILERQENGTYKKISSGMDIDAAIRIVDMANEQDAKPKERLIQNFDGTNIPFSL